MLSVIPVIGFPEVAPGTDLTSLIAEFIARQGHGLVDGDIVVVTQKIVSKAERRFVSLASLEPSSRTTELAQLTCKDPRLVELVLRESPDIVQAACNVLIARHRLG